MNIVSGIASRLLSQDQDLAFGFAAAAGYGAVALSWCEGAALDQVWAGWLASGFPLKPLPEFE